MMKKKMPLRCGNTNRGQGKTHYKYYTPEFDERQAERVWNCDMTMLLVGVIVVLALCVLGVI